MPAKKTSASSGISKWDDVAVPLSSLKKTYEALSTGSITLDLALLYGGIVKGGIARIYGRKGSLKTTLCQRMTAKALAKGIPVLWIDAETAFVPFIAMANGIPENDPLFRIWRSNPYKKMKLTYENMAQIIEAWVMDEDWAPNGCLVIVDSLSAVVTEKQLEADVEDAQVASVSRYNARWFPTIAPKLEARNSTIVFVQQMRAVIGGTAWGEHDDPGGGYALKHYAMTEIKLSHGKREGSEVGQPIQFDIRANKYAYPHIRDRFFFRTDYGIDTPRELIDLGLKLGLVTKGGAFYRFVSLGNESAYQGMEAARGYLIEHPDAMDELENQIRQKATNVEKPSTDSLLPEPEDAVEYN